MKDLLKIVCFTLPYGKHPFERALEGIARAGYRYVAFGLPHAGADVPDEQDEEAVSRLQKLFADYSLEPALLIGTKQFYVEEPLERAIRRLQLAKQLGIKEIISSGTKGYHRFPHEPWTAAESAAQHIAFVEKFKQIAAAAASLDRIVTLKPHGGNTGVGRVLSQTLQQIGSPHIRASYDPGNVHYYEGVAAAADFPAIADQTSSICIKDHKGARGERNFPMIGAGDVDFLSIFRTWKEAEGFGSVIVETVGTSENADELDLYLAEARTRLEHLLDKVGFSYD